MRQQEVMSYLIEAMEKNHDFRESLATYRLVKSQNYYGYGIAFHTEAIQPSMDKHRLVYPFVEIEPGTPADLAQMKTGQRVVAVNGLFVNDRFQTIEDIVAAIEDSYNNQDYTDLTVIEPELWVQCYENPLEAAELAGYRPLPNDDRTLIGMIITLFYSTQF